MSFECFCVGIIVCVLTTGITGFIGMLISLDDDTRDLRSWLISSICLGVCVTYLLYDNGLI